MKTFDFYRDEKCSVWTRSKFSVEAETYEQAVQKVLDMEDNCDYDEVDSQFEVLFETMDELTPDVNEDKSTIELFSSDTNALIFENGIVKNNFPK
jgi:hypothetical protein